VTLICRALGSIFILALLYPAIGYWLTHASFTKLWKPCDVAQSICLSNELRQIERHLTLQTNRSAQRVIMGGIYYLTHNYGADIARRGPS
jgi:hypothetical protein